MRGGELFSTMQLAIWGTEVAWIAAWTQQACYYLGLTPREVTPLFQIAHLKARGQPRASAGRTLLLGTPLGSQTLSLIAWASRGYALSR
jgi:hypothetical protein